jgi:hypothetical protein
VAARTGSSDRRPINKPDRSVRVRKVLIIGFCALDNFDGRHSKPR